MIFENFLQQNLIKKSSNKSHWLNWSLRNLNRTEFVFVKKKKNKHNLSAYDELDGVEEESETRTNCFTSAKTYISCEQKYWKHYFVIIYGNWTSNDWNFSTFCIAISILRIIRIKLFLGLNYLHWRNLFTAQWLFRHYKCCLKTSFSLTRRNRRLYLVCDTKVPWNHIFFQKQERKYDTIVYRYIIRIFLGQQICN